MKSRPELLDILRDTIVGSVRQDAPDLTARQIAMLLVCSLDEPPHTVRGLAALLDVPKPAITRNVDRLAGLGFMKREDDPSDRRSVLLVATPSGRAFVEGLAAMMRAAAEGRSPAPATTRSAAG
jgi:DNA-binding MarR family transcriptional regulator